MNAGKISRGRIDTLLAEERHGWNRTDDGESMSGHILEIHPCRVCQEQTANPDQLCSKACWEEVYNENERDSADYDERHPDTLDDGDEEVDPDEEA